MSWSYIDSCDPFGITLQKLQSSNTLQCDSSFAALVQEFSDNNNGGDNRLLFKAGSNNRGGFRYNITYSKKFKNTYNNVTNIISSKFFGTCGIYS